MDASCCGLWSMHPVEPRPSSRHIPSATSAREQFAATSAAPSSPGHARTDCTKPGVPLAFQAEWTHFRQDLGALTETKIEQLGKCTIVCCAIRDSTAANFGCAGARQPEPVRQVATDGQVEAQTTTRSLDHSQTIRRRLDTSVWCPKTEISAQPLWPAECLRMPNEHLEVTTRIPPSMCGRQSETGGCAPGTTTLRHNCAIAPCSSLSHRTDRFAFRPDLDNRRGNIAMRYGLCCGSPPGMAGQETDRQPFRDGDRADPQSGRSYPDLWQWCLQPVAHILRKLLPLQR